MGRYCETNEILYNFYANSVSSLTDVYFSYSVPLSKTFLCLAKATLALQAPENCSCCGEADLRCRRLCSVEIIGWDNRKRDNALMDETSCRTVLEPGRPDERTALCTGSGHVRIQPNYMATNELPIRRIYCLVLSQELIKSTQLKRR